MLKRAQIEDFRFHDLRHNFASYLVMSGVDIRTVQELLGHKSLRMTERYLHLAPEHLKNAVENLQKVVTNWTHPVENKKVKNSGIPYKSKWAEEDSNLRPPVCETGVLAT